MAEFIRLEDTTAAKNMPCAYNGCAVFYKGAFRTISIPDKRLLKTTLAHWDNLDRYAVEKTRVE